MSGGDESQSYLCQYRDGYTGQVDFSQPGNVIVTETTANSLSKPDTISGVFRVKEGGAVVFFTDYGNSEFALWSQVGGSWSWPY